MTDLGRLAELVERLERRGLGVTLLPIKKGDFMGGWGSSDRYQFDGWEVGYISPGGGGEIAVGRSIAEAVEAALEVDDG